MDKTATAPKTLLDAIRHFANPDACLQAMIAVRWPDSIVTCPACGRPEPRFLASRRVWQCAASHPHRQFSAKVGAIFEDSPLGLDKWLPAVWMLTNSKNGISSYELARALGVTQTSAWFMLHRIRAAMQTESADPFSGDVEVDETFIGGKARFMHKGKRAAKIKGTGGMGKAAVMGLLERHGPDGHSRVRVKPIPNVRRRTLSPEVRQHVEPGAAVYTDALKSYEGLAPDYTHQVIDHAEAYVRGKVHTNGLENFWSLLKRGLKGTYVSVEPLHLFRYFDEQAFRFNERKDGDAGRFVKALRSIVGRRLTYRALTSDPSLATTPA